MISRTLKWRVRRGEIGGWTATSTGWWSKKLDLSFTIEPGRAHAIVNKNARLIVRKREEGKKVATKVLFSKQFDSSYRAKNVVDALIYTAITFYDDPEEIEKWFLDTLRSYNGAPLPAYNGNGRTYNNGHGWAN